MAKNKIHIKAKNKGKFTKSAKAAGESVQEHAHKVMKNPNATPLQKKRANFAIQAKKWAKHKDGGEVNTYPFGGLSLAPLMGKQGVDLMNFNSSGIVQGQGSHMLMGELNPITALGSPNPYDANQMAQWLAYSSSPQAKQDWMAKASPLQKKLAPMANEQGANMLQGLFKNGGKLKKYPDGGNTPMVGGDVMSNGYYQFNDPNWMQQFINQNPDNTSNLSEDEKASQISQKKKTFSSPKPIDTNTVTSNQYVNRVMQGLNSKNPLGYRSAGIAAGAGISDFIGNIKKDKFTKAQENNLLFNQIDGSLYDPYNFSYGQSGENRNQAYYADGGETDSFQVDRYLHGEGYTYNNSNIHIGRVLSDMNGNFISAQPVTGYKKFPEVESMKITEINNINTANKLINPLPFAEGTYFTRQRQSQEAEQGKVDHFDKKTGKLLGTFSDGGITNYKSDNNGNMPTAEVEGGEVLNLNNGLAEMIKGKKHSEGGIDVSVPEGTKVFSEKLKFDFNGKKKKSFAKEANKFSTKKDFEIIESNKTTPLAKSTAELNIKLKNQQLDSLFQIQEGLKMEGHFGSDVKKETMKDYKMTIKEYLEGFAEYIYDSGIINGEQHGQVFEMISEYLNDIHSEMTTKEYLEGFADYIYDSDIIDSGQHKRVLQQISDYLNDIHSEMTKKFGGKIKFKNGGKIKFKNGGEKDNEWKQQIFSTPYGYLTPTGKNLNQAPYVNWLGVRDMWQPFSDTPLDTFPKLQEFMYDYSLDQAEKGNKAYLNQLLNMWKGYGITNKDEDSFKKYQAKVDAGTATIDDLKALRGNFIDKLRGKRALAPIVDSAQISSPQLTDYQKGMGDTPVNNAFNSINYQDKKNKIPRASFIPVPKSYSEDPLFTSQLAPQLIDPRYLNIQSQVNEINRGQRGLFNKMKGIQSVDRANLAQGQINSYNQLQSLFGEKYNYDRQQDSASQQFNAQSKANTNLQNLQERNRFMDMIQRRRGALDTQMRMDANKDIENQMLVNQWNTTSDFLQNTLHPTTSYTFGQGLLPYNPDDNETITITYDKNDNIVSKKVTKKKFGGKIKLKKSKK